MKQIKPKELIQAKINGPIQKYVNVGRKTVRNSNETTRVNSNHNIEQKEIRKDSSEDNIMHKINHNEINLKSPRGSGGTMDYYERMKHDPNYRQLYLDSERS